MQFNPYGPKQETQQRAQRIFEIVKHRPLLKVCGYNYVANFADWLTGFEYLIQKNG